MSEYRVLVENIGTVHRGADKTQAETIYHHYVDLSTNRVGRSALAAVTLLLDQEIVLEHIVRDVHYEIEEWCASHEEECCEIVERLARDLFAPEGSLLDEADEFISGSDFIDIFFGQVKLHGLHQILYPTNESGI